MFTPHSSGRTGPTRRRASALVVLVLMLANLFVTATASQAKEDKTSDATFEAFDSKEAEKAEKEAAKEAEKAAKKAAKEAEKAAKEAAKAAEKAEKEAAKEAEKAAKEAEKAAKEEAKADKKAEKEAAEQAATADKASDKCATYNVVYSSGAPDTGTFCGGNDVTQANTPGLRAVSFHVSCSDDLSNPTKSDFGGLVVESWRIETSKGKVCGSDSSATTTKDDGKKKKDEKEKGGKGDKCFDYVVMYTNGASDQGSFCGGNEVNRSNTPGLNAITLHVSCSDDLSNPTKSNLGGLTVDKWSIVKAGGKTCGSPTPPTPEYSAVAAPNCLEGGTVVLRNTGETTVTFTVTVDGTAFPAQTLPKGAERTLPVSVPEDGSVDVVVTVDGTTILNATIERDCEPPPTPEYSASAVPNCLAGGSVTLENTGGTPVTFTVLVDGTTIATPTLQPGGTTSLPVSVPEDGSVVVRVIVDGTTILNDTIARDCDGPPPTTEYSASAVPNCLAGGTVVLKNTGETPVTFTVLVDGTTIATPTLQPGGTTNLPVSVPEDGSVDVVVTVGGTTILNDTIARNCDEPPPPGSPDVSASFSCAAGGTLVLDNSTSEIDRIFDITIDGVLEVLVVAAGEVEIVTFDVDEDTTSTLTVVSEGVTLLDEDFAADCTSVLGVDVEREDPLPAPLPAADPVPAPEVGPTNVGNLPSTGSDAARLLLLGLLLIGIGVPVIRQSRLGRQHR